MSPISRGFHRRRQPDADPSRVPPGQYVTGDFPVLSAGPTPHTPLEEWSFTIRGAVEEAVSWPWEEFVALPSETITTDIHCVTKWSKLDTSWKGVSVDTLLEAVQSDARVPDGLVGWRLHDEPGTRGRNRRPSVGRLRIRRCAARARARRAGAHADSSSVLLEEREVGARADAHPR